MKKYIYHEKKEETSLIFYIPNFITSNESKQYLSLLNEINSNEWKGGFAFGREIPRLQRWYSKNNQYFYPKWHMRFDRWQPQTYEEWLNILQEKVSTKLENIFTNYYKEYSSFKHFNVNSTQINYYRNQDDMIPQHRDHLKTFGENPSIAILSLGSERNMKFERIDPCSENIRIMKEENDKNINIKLEHGSMIIMAGTTQKYFSHGIPREYEEYGKRYSLTFRNHQIFKDIL